MNSLVSKGIRLLIVLLRFISFIGMLSLVWMGNTMLFLVDLLSLVRIILVIVVVLVNSRVWVMLFWFVVVLMMSNILVICLVFFLVTCRILCSFFIRLVLVCSWLVVLFSIRL